MKDNNYNMEGYNRLAAAVVEQAVKDYRRALKRLHRWPGDPRAKETVKECERFFRRDMGAYADLDGEQVIRAVRKRVSREMRTCR